MTGQKKSRLYFTEDLSGRALSSSILRLHNLALLYFFQAYASARGGLWEGDV